MNLFKKLFLTIIIFFASFFLLNFIGNLVGFVIRFIFDPRNLAFSSFFASTTFFETIKIVSFLISLGIAFIYFTRGEKKLNPNKKILIVLVFLFLIILSVTKSKLGEMMLCKLVYKGDYWNGEPIISGCFIEYKDTGKPCTKGAECIAGACEIGRYTQPDSSGKYQGQCPAGRLGLEYFPLCGSATIEDGQIVKDMRDCIY